MSEEPAPYWVLISVLFSSLPLTQRVARRLHETAYDLYREDGSVATLAEDLLHGTVTNLHKDASLGTIVGPVFEARLDTERGSGTVRFLLTRPGIELMTSRRTATTLN